MKLKFILGAAALLAMTACTRPETSQEILEAHGYTDVDIGGYAVFGCSEDDTFRTQFEATSPSGQHVTGVVCDGVFKGATIRIQRSQGEG